MIDATEIGEIIAVYRKHGWILRRVLLSTASQERLGDGISNFIGGVSIIACDIDAAWFSRSKKPGGVAWEIRQLSETPYALLENIDENSAEFEDQLRAVKSRLRETALAVKSA